MPENPLKILLVEDLPSDVHLVRLALMKGGGEVFAMTHADRLDTALEKLGSPEKFDVVLLDLGLPDAQGVEVLRRIHAAAPNLPIVILSALDRGEAIFEAIQLGAQDYIVKGELDRRMLRRAIHYAIERKRAELGLRASQERLRFAIEAAGDAIVLADPEGRILSWNHGAQAMFGLTGDEAKGRMISSLTPERYRLQKDSAFFRPGIMRAGASGTKTLQLVGLRQAREEFPIEISLSRSEISEQVVLCAIIRDISDRKQNEATLLESELRFRTLTELSPVGIFNTDMEGNCLFVNSRWCELTGLTHEMAAGTGWAQALHPEDRERVFAAWNESVRTRSRFALEYRFQTPQGVTHWVFGQAMPLKTDGGEMLGCVGTVTDISERKQAEVERESHIQELKDALANMKQLNSLISICAQCKKIRDDDGEWSKFEVYFKRHTNTSFTHGLCPVCTKEFLDGVKPRTSMF